MSVVLAQGGTNLYTVDCTSGAVTQLTLPAGVTLSTTRKPRFAMLNQWGVMVNSPSQNLSIDPSGVVAPLVPRAPLQPPVVSTTGSASLDGDYQYKVTFIITNSNGDLLTESPMSPASQVTSIVGAAGALTNIPTSLDTISARRIYRTLAGGSAYFIIGDLDGNTATTWIDSAEDSTVTLLPAAPAGLISPPGTLPGMHFKIITEWKSRLWAVADGPNYVDTVYFTNTNQVYTWPNSLVAFPTGRDSQGVVAFAPRKNALGLLKRNGVWAIMGTASTTGISTTNISVSQIAFDKAGCIAPDSVVVINDVAYWLGRDGVYMWDDNGVQNITNDQVAAWFKTDTYFNRSRFPNAFAKYNELRDTYDLHLDPVGTSTEGEWVSFYRRGGAWYGPHTTAQLTPSHAGVGLDNNGLPVAMIGGTDGVLYTMNNATHTDGTSAAIDFEVISPLFPGDAPDIQHYFDMPSSHTRIETGGTLTLTPYLGGTSPVAQAPISIDLTQGRQRLPRIGTGLLVQFKWSQDTVGQGCAIYGLEQPFFEVGRR